jgi:short-subunit dehydrogenase
MKKAIVIGATSEIGKGLAELLARDGYTVGITGRRAELLIDVKQRNPDITLLKRKNGSLISQSVGVRQQQLFG